MLRLSFAALLFLSAAALCQPLEGPFTVIELSTMATITNPHLTLRNADTADVFYQIADTVFHAAVSLHNGQILAGPEGVLRASGGATVQFCGAVWSGSEWAALVYEVNSINNNTILLRGLNSLRADTVIDWGLNNASQWFASSINISPTISARIGGGFIVGWIDYWTAWRGSWYESGYELQTWDFPAGQAEGSYHFAPCSNFDVLFLRSISADSVLAVCGVESYGVYTQMAVPPEMTDHETGCSADLVDVLLSHRRTALLLSRSVNGQFTPRVMETVNDTCSERLVLNSDPKAATSHPDYGLAWLAGGATELYLTRADTTGAMHLLPGLVAEPQTGYSMGEAALAMTDNGLLAALWVESSPLDSNHVSLRLATVGWDTPLTAHDPRFSLPPSAFSLSCFPNPFNSEVEIRYDVPRTQNVELSVYNLLGQRVASLFDGMKSAGSHSVTWSPHTGSGIYFVTLKSAETVRTSKVVCLR